jgi:type VI secretion system secreted protein VgrG
VATLWAGKQWGVIHIPRIDQEVIVDFLEGDPDQPIIVGSVYNAREMPPYALPDNKTQSGIKSRSSKSGTPDNFNEFRFEDKKGEEEIYLHAEKDWNIRVENDEKEFVEANRHATINKSDSKKIGGTKSVTVTGDVLESFKSNHKETVTAEYSLKANKIIVEGELEITLKVGGNFIKIDMTGITIQGMPMTKINSGGAPGVSTITDEPADPETVD